MSVPASLTTSAFVDDDDDDATIARMEKLLKIKKKKVDKEMVASGLQFLLNYKDDVKKLQQRGLNAETLESEDDNPEEISSHGYEKGSSIES